VSLKKQTDYSTKVSLSSRQKALTEEVCYRILMARDAKARGQDFTLQIEDIKVLLKRWELSQKAIHTVNESMGLTESHSEEIEKLLNVAAPLYATAHNASDAMIQHFEETSEMEMMNVIDAFKRYVKSMNDVTGRFLIEQQKSMTFYKWYVVAVAMIIFILMVFVISSLRKNIYAGLSDSENEIVQMRKAIEEAGRVKGEFLANMSHEIRTPLNGIIGMTELLAATKLSDDQRQFVKNVHSSGINLLELLNNLLDVTKLQAGKIELNKESFNLSDCIDQVIEMLKPAAQQKRLELLSEIKPSLPVEVVQDGTRLKQVLVNLVNNAIKFTDSGEVLITVEETNREGNFIMLLFKVTDTGIGIDKEEQEKIFQSFYQADSSARKRYSGTGLGLSISKNYINEMGGKLWVESEPGHGSVFAFTMVAEISESQQRTHIAALNGLKALIVDDNKTNLKILVRQLSAWGIQTTPFNSPELVAEMLSNLHKFDFVIMDMQMPEMDGKELTEKIRQSYTPEQLPIIVLSSLGQDLIVDNENLYNAYLTKPVRQAKLLETIYGLLSSSSRQQNNERRLGRYDRSDEKRLIRVLVAHDSELSQAVAAKTLSLLGHKFDIVSNNSELLLKTRTDQYDIIIMDVHAGKVDGIAIARQLNKSIDPKEMPILLGVSDNVDKDRLTCISAGMTDLISRPISPENVESQIQRWLDV
jgi:signal transduction histidine kinase/DNA-binding response OmpR family regulator